MGDDSSDHNGYCMFEDAALQLTENISELERENERLRLRIEYLTRALEEHECIGCLDIRYPHPKLRDIKCETIQPFFKAVKTAVKEGKYTLNHFCEGYKGFVRFLLEITSLGDERNYVYIPETKSFYMLSDYHRWAKDEGCKYIRFASDYMRDVRDEHWKKVVDRILVSTEITLFYESLVRSRSAIEQRRVLMMIIQDSLIPELSI